MEFELAKLRAELTIKKARCDALTKDRDQLRAEAAHREHETITLRNILQNATECVGSLQREVHELKRAVGESRKRELNANAQAARDANAATTLKRKPEKAQHECEVFMRECDAMRRENVALNAKLNAFEELRQNIIELRKICDAMLHNTEEHGVTHRDEQRSNEYAVNDDDDESRSSLGDEPRGETNDSLYGTKKSTMKWRLRKKRNKT
jgi:chromosome segregation ATPase